MKSIADTLTARQIPPLPFLTMCLWIQFNNPVHNRHWSMASYVTFGGRSTHQLLNLLWARVGDEMTLTVVQDTRNGHYELEDR